MWSLKKMFMVLILGVFGFAPLVGAESIEMKTYYPSPSGYYDKLHTNDMYLTTLSVNSGTNLTINSNLVVNGTTQTVGALTTNTITANGNIGVTGSGTVTTVSGNMSTTSGNIITTSGNVVVGSPAKITLSSTGSIVAQSSISSGT